MVAVILVVLVIVGLAMVVKYVVEPAVAFVSAHLALTILGSVLTLVVLACFLRLFIAVLERSVVMGWKSNFVRPPRRGLPDPIESTGFESSRPFTLEDDPPVEPMPVSSVLACEGPHCDSGLPEDQNMRWRIGTATVPQTTEDEDFPEDTEDIHEFCSEACLNRWQSANHAAS